MGLFGLFPLIFPAVGLVFILAGLAKGRRAIRLLKHGQQTTGELISKEPTNARINDQMVYKLTFEFRADDGATHNAVAKSHLPAVLEDEPEEPLLYDPMNPDRCVMLDDLPGSPRIDEQGSIRSSSPARTIFTLFIPLVTILGHGTYLYLRLFVL